MIVFNILKMVILMNVHLTLLMKKYFIKQVKIDIFIYILNINYLKCHHIIIVF